MSKKDINKTILSKSYVRMTFTKFKTSMEKLGFEGDFAKAYKSIGGVVQSKKKGD